MKTPPATALYKGHRFPAEILGHCVWLYFRFCLSYRDVEEIMAERGVIVTYETIRQTSSGAAVLVLGTPGTSTKSFSLLTGNGIISGVPHSHYLRQHGSQTSINLGWLGNGYTMIGWSMRVRSLV
jgi:hypothetical protein